METNIIVAGVGGQGILSIAFVLDNAAMKEGFNFKQAEVHGMSQRGGAVQSHLRFSKEEIFSDLIPEGGADLILSVEPLESLRYYHYLKPDGVVITSAAPFVNIPDYPQLEEVYRKISQHKNHILIDSEGLAKLAGSPRAQNMVMLGAANYLLPFDRAVCMEFVEQLFRGKGEKAVNINRAAFQYGEQVSSFFRGGLEHGLSPEQTRRLCFAVDPSLPLETKSLAAWRELFGKHPDLFPSEGWGKRKRIPASEAMARELMKKGELPAEE
ncbi:MAG: indolepyruvate oxidoreductase subunit beta [Planctomycetota bacterium]